MEMQQWISDTWYVTTGRIVRKLSDCHCSKIPSTDPNGNHNSDLFYELPEFAQNFYSVNIFADWRTPRYTAVTGNILPNENITSGGETYRKMNRKCKEIQWRHAHAK